MCGSGEVLLPSPFSSPPGNSPCIPRIAAAASRRRMTQGGQAPAGVRPPPRTRMASKRAAPASAAAPWPPSSRAAAAALASRGDGARAAGVPSSDRSGAGRERGRAGGRRGARGGCVRGRVLRSQGEGRRSWRGQAAPCAHHFLLLLSHLGACRPPPQPGGGQTGGEVGRGSHGEQRARRAPPHPPFQGGEKKK